MKFIKAITLAIIISLIFACSLERESNYVATINGDKISVEDFLNNYRNFLKITGIRDNMSNRKMLLENVINEKLLLSEFDKNNVGKNDDYINQKKYLKQQLLLNHYYKNEILSLNDFNNTDMIKYYTQANTYYHIKQVFAVDKNQAEDYYRKLRDGWTFDDLTPAENNFSKEQCNKKTDLGFIKLKGINPRFRNKITKLSIGELSLPIRGKYGYTILKVVGKKPSPLPTKYEFAKQKPFLAERLKKDLSDSLSYAYTHKLRSQINFIWNEKGLDRLLNVFKEVKSKEDLYSVYEKFGISGDAICQTDKASFSFTDLLPMILKSKYRDIKAVRNTKLLKEFVSGIIIRERIIHLAKSKKIQLSSEFQKDYLHKTTKLKMDFWVQSFSDSVQFTDAIYNYFYQANKDQFIVPIKRKVYEIRTQDKIIAQNLEKNVNSSKNFQHLAKKYSHHQNEMYSDGLLGILSSDELGNFGTAIFSTPLGKVVGPYFYNGYYYLFLSTDEFESHSLSLDSAKPLIAKRYREELMKRKMASHFAKLSKKYQVQHNFRILKEIKYIDIGGGG